MTSQRKRLTKHKGWRRRYDAKQKEKEVAYASASTPPDVPANHEAHSNKVRNEDRRKITMDSSRGSSGHDNSAISPQPMEVNERKELTPRTKETVRRIIAGGKVMRGRPFNRHLQNAIWNLYQFNKLEKKLKTYAINPDLVLERTAAQLKVSIKTVVKYVHLAKQGNALLTPNKSRKRSMPKSVDSFDRVAIQSLIYEFHRLKKHFTLQILLDKIRKREIGFQGGRETLRQIIQQMGFRYLKKDGSSYLRQTSSIALQRVAFLSQYCSLKKEDTYDFVFLDETWVFRKGTGKGKAWQDGTAESNPVKFASYGDRYVVIGAGSRRGWVPNSLKVFSTKKRPVPGDDYHGDLNGEIFFKWFTEDFVPNLERKSVIVLDNAAYHRVQEEDSKNPTTQWRTGRIVEWLLDEGVPPEDTWGKTVKELLQLARTKKKPLRIRIEEAIKGTEHVILWLPPYHAALYNPIELIWSQTKGYYENHIMEYPAFTDAATLACMEEARKSITPEHWLKCCEHSERIIQQHAAECVGTFKSGAHPRVEGEVGLSEDDESDSDPLSTNNLSGVKMLSLTGPHNAQAEFTDILQNLPHPPSTLDLQTSVRKRPRGRRDARRNIMATFTSPEDDFIEQVAVVLNRGSYGWTSPLHTKKNRDAAPISQGFDSEPVDLADENKAHKQQFAIDAPLCSGAEDFDYVSVTGTPNHQRVEENFDQQNNFDETGSVAADFSSKGDFNSVLGTPGHLECAESAQTSVLDSYIDLTSFCNKDSDVLVVPAEKRRFRLNEDDVRSLRKGEQINDTVIDWYLQLACERHPERRALPFSVHVQTGLTNAVRKGDWNLLKASVPRRAWRIDEVNPNQLLFPINVKGEHWTLCVVDLLCDVVKYYDSLRWSDYGAMERIGTFVNHLLASRGLQSRVWNYVHVRKDLARQMPEHKNDCGAFLMFYVRALLDGKHPKWTPDLTSFRLQIRRELDSDTLEPTP